MNREQISKAERFLKETYAASTYMQENPADMSYRLEHAYRVANIAKQIAEKEGFDVTYAVLGGLLHDISYIEDMPDREVWKEHGRVSAAMARPFLQELGLPEKAVNDICYSIAIHVDDKADFSWERTSFSEIVGDADNIDRFDVYRVYESLEFNRFSEKMLEGKQEHVAATLERLHKLKKMPLGSETANVLWQQRLAYYLEFFGKLQEQLSRSGCIAD